MDDIVAACVADLRVLAPGATDPVLEEVAGDLVSRWSSPTRAYHGLRHLAEMLAALGRLAAQGALDDHELLVCRVAGWFHDAVHETGSEPGADEEASAALAVDALDRLGADVDLIERVGSLVLATADHVPTDDPASRAFVDADLWVLAAPEARFDDYCAGVREECSQVPDAEFRAGRSALLRALLSRETVYCTEQARAAWEAQARRNVEHELDRLGAAG